MSGRQSFVVVHAAVHVVVIITRLIDSFQIVAVVTEAVQQASTDGGDGIHQSAAVGRHSRCVLCAVERRRQILVEVIVATVRHLMRHRTVWLSNNQPPSALQTL